MKKNKIIPYRILNSNSTEDAKLLVTNRKETKIRIQPKIKSPMISCKSACSKLEEGASTCKPSTSCSSRPFSQSSFIKLSFLSPAPDITADQLSQLKLTASKSVDNMSRLKSLKWKTSMPHPILSPSQSQFTYNQDFQMLSPSILPKIYSFRPFLMPFINDAKFQKEETQEAPKPDNSDFKVLWTLKDSAGDRPNGREGPVLVALKGKIYLYGGQSRVKHTELRLLDIGLWSWKILNANYAPPGRLGHSLVVYKGKLVLYGGQSQHSQNLGIRRCSRKVFYFSPSKKKWQHYSGEGEKPEGRRHHAAAELGRYMIVYGGMNQQGHILSDLYVLDMKFKAWALPEVSIESDPGPRSHATLTGIFDQRQRENYTENIFELTLHNAKIEFLNCGFYLFGGLSAEGVTVNSLHGLYIRGGKLVWSLIKGVTGTTPAPRYGHAACCVKNRLFVFGGRNDALFKLKGDSALGDLCCFNVSTLKWETLKIMGQSPEGRWGHTMVNFGNKVLIFGGICNKHYMPSDIFMLDTEKEMMGSQSEEIKSPEPQIYNYKERQKTLKAGSFIQLLKLGK